MMNIKEPLPNPIDKCLIKLSRYHYYVFFLIFLSKLPMFWHMLNLLFLSPPMGFDCNGTEKGCPCDNPSWNRTVFTETMQTKFGIYCDNTWLLNFAHSTAFFGTLLGALLFGFLSDRFGRLNTFCLSYGTIATAGCLVAIMPTIATFICMRLIEGIGVGGAIVTSYVLCIEYCGVKHREIVTALFHIPINLGHLSLPGISYLFRNMNTFQLVISIPIFAFIAMKWLMMESPKWLLDHNKVDELTKGMKKICRNVEHLREDIEEYIVNYEANEIRIKFFEIFKHNTLTLNFVCMSVIYFVCGMAYYGVSQFIGEMAGNIHVNVALSALMLLPGTISCIFLLNVCSRRYFMMISNFFAGIFMIAVVCTPSNINWLRVTFASISNCFFFISFIIVFLYGIELFPTSIRNSVLGVLSVISRIGQILAPPINSLSQTAAGATFGVMAIIGGLICLPLPETKGLELPTSLGDTYAMNKKILINDQNTSGKTK